MCKKINTMMSTGNTMVLNHIHCHWHKTHFIGSPQGKQTTKEILKESTGVKQLWMNTKPPLKPEYVESWYNFSRLF